MRMLLTSEKSMSMPAFSRDTRYIHDITLNLRFESIAVSMEVFAFGFVVGHPVPCIRLYISSNGCRHAYTLSFSSNIMEAELMQYRSPP